MARNWTEHELMIAMSLYCRLPFGQCNSRNKLVNEVARKMDRTAGSVSRKLGNLASMDPQHQSRGVGGLPHSSALDRKVWSDFQHDWHGMAEKSEAAFEVLMNDSSFHADNYTDVPKTPEGPTEAERTVKTRRVQRFFRNTVLASYNYRCALTGMSAPQLLVASHIIPWKDSKERRADPTNGLCLNALHDKAFDRHLITFDERLRLVVSKELKKKNIPEFQSVNFGEMEGTAVSVGLTTPYAG